MSNANLATYLDDQAFAAKRAAEELADTALSGRATDETLLALDEAIDDATSLAASRSALGVTNVREPDIYSATSTHSYFADWAEIRQNGFFGPAADRLRRSSEVESVRLAGRRHNQRASWKLPASLQSATSRLISTARCRSV